MRARIPALNLAPAPGFSHVVAAATSAAAAGMLQVPGVGDASPALPAGGSDGGDTAAGAAHHGHSNSLSAYTYMRKMSANPLDAFFPGTTPAPGTGINTSAWAQAFATVTAAVTSPVVRAVTALTGDDTLATDQQEAGAMSPPLNPAEMAATAAAAMEAAALHAQQIQAGAVWASYSYAYALAVSGIQLQSLQKFACRMVFGMTPLDCYGSVCLPSGGPRLLHCDTHVHDLAHVTTLPPRSALFACDRLERRH
mgnify:CR=1 FL=1